MCISDKPDQISQIFPSWSDVAAWLGEHENNFIVQAKTPKSIVIDEPSWMLRSIKEKEAAIKKMEAALMFPAYTSIFSCSNNHLICFLWLLLQRKMGG